MAKDNKKKIVIHCATGIENSGDEAILMLLLQRYAIEFDVTVISLNPKNTLAMINDIPIRIIHNKSHQCKSAIKECDIFILGGGGLLQDKTTLYNVWRWLDKLKIALKYNKKTCIYANSIGELKYSINRKRVQKYLRKANLIMLRDEISAQLLREMGIVDNVFVTADPVFSYTVPTETEIQKEMANRILPDRYICLCVRHWFDTYPLIPVNIVSKLGLRSNKYKDKYEQYICMLSNTVKTINNEIGLPVIFLSFCHERDTKVAQEVLTRVNTGLKNHIVDEQYMRPETYMAIISASEALVGMRLHSLIYAINMHVPAVAMVYQDKVAGVVEQTNLCMVDVNHATSEQLTELLRSVLTQKEEERVRLSQIHEKIKNQEKRNDELFRGIALKA